MLFANRAAEAVLARNDGLGVAQGCLCGASAGLTAALHRLVAAAAGLLGVGPSGGTLRLDRPSGRRALSVQATPLHPAALPAWMPVARPAVLLLIGDPDAAATRSARQRLLALYGLTPAEAAVATLVATGTGPAAVAQTLGVAPATVRTHLHRVFAKTGTGGQAELVTLLAALSVASS